MSQRHGEDRNSFCEIMFKTEFAFFTVVITIALFVFLSFLRKSNVDQYAGIENTPTILDKFFALPGPAAGFLLVAPPVIFWFSKIAISELLKLPPTVTLFHSLPLFIGFYVLVFIFSLDIVLLSKSNFVKIYLPIIFLSMTATFLMSFFGTGYLTENGYDKKPRSTASYDNILIGQKFIRKD